MFFQEIKYGLFFRGKKLVDDVRGKWTKIQVHANWTTEKSGFLRVYANGELKFRNDGYATLRPENMMPSEHIMGYIELISIAGPKSRNLKAAPKQTVRIQEFFYFENWTQN